MLHLKKYLSNPLFLIQFLGFWFFIPEVSHTVQAQIATTEAKDTAQAVLPQWAEDSLGRRTPHGTIDGFIKAVADENYEKAAFYLRLDTTMRENQNGAVLAKNLQHLLDQNGKILPYALLSDDVQGVQDDNLGPNLDRIGSATLNGETFDLFLEKTEGPDGGPVWLFSSQTVKRIPLSLVQEQTETPLVNKVSPEVLQEKKWSGVPINHWFAILLLAVAAYAIAWAIITFLLFVIPKVWHRAGREPIIGILRAFTLPLKLYLAVWIVVAASEQVGISIIVRQRFSQVTILVGTIAILLLLWRLLDFITRYIERRMTRHHNMAAVSAVLFLRRGAKIALIVMGVIFFLDTLGFDVTTGLAALGIGGIALALGAQKTVENFVGSVTLIADQPIRVGDFCKVGETMGTVEQIGMRSTQIRTLDRTIVTIPNGELSSLRVENFGPRDKFWFHPLFALRYETTPDQIRYLLVEIRSILYAHPKVDPNPARVRFIGIGQNSLNLEIFSYINTADNDEFLEIQEDLLLRIMDVVKASGTDFAFPSQTLYMARDKGVSPERTQEAETKVQEWRASNELQLPKFSPERINSLKNSIPYPPEGASKK